MLRLREKTIDDRGYYRRGSYSLRISPIVDGSIEIGSDRAVDNFDFAPNPTDLDDTMQFASNIQPDHASGYYIDNGEIGSKTISIRGTTGQKPTQNVAERLLGTSAITNSGVPRANQDDGYTIWQKIFNFFVNWAEVIRDNPHGYAMMFLNAKDAEIFQVQPITVRKVRTSARPMSYGYAIDLQIVGEEEPVDLRNWLDRIDDIRQQVNRWSTAMSKVIVLAANLLSDLSLGGLGVIYEPSINALGSMTTSLQGFMYTAKKIKSNAAYSHERLKEVAEELANANLLESGHNAVTKTIDTVGIPAGSVPGVYPPTAEATYDLLAPSSIAVTENTVYNLTDTTLIDPNDGIRSDLALDDPNIEHYGNSLEILFETLLAVDSAPLPSSTPAGTAGQESRDIHRAARAGGAGDLEGREEIMASAVLAGSTTLLEDTVVGVETRHAVRQQKTIETYTLSHLAAITLRDWARSHNDRISPQLSAFRKWYLGMRDPNTFAPVYRNVEVGIFDTIYSLASRYLGHWSRWPEIALVNGLKYPYVSEQGGPFQLKPGELAAIPQSESKIPVEVIEDLIQISKTHDLLTTQDLFLGFDVEISQITGDMVYSVYDIAHLGGVQAFEQEVSLVMEGSGGVTPDRTAGPRIRIGSKSRGRESVELWGAVLRLWLINDHRVKEVEWVRVEQDGGIVRFSSKLKFENFDTATTVAGELRS